tara:strand:+ start:17 stop:331 length:315 start_codon:yes stop_codon:yes gene_type:complete
MTYLADDVWGIVKEFMLDWKIGWNKKMKLTLEDINSRLPRYLIMERYDMKTKLYHTTFSAPSVRPRSWSSCGREELRVCNNYNASENRWIDAYYSGDYSNDFGY